MHRPIHNSFRLTQLAAAMVFSACPALADELIVTIDNIKDAGEIHVAIYDSAAAFEADRGEKGGRRRASRRALSNILNRAPLPIATRSHPGPMPSAYSTTPT